MPIRPNPPCQYKARWRLPGQHVTPLTFAAVLADGPVRDIDEARALSFPVFAKSLTAQTARGRIIELGTDVPIRFGETTLHPGEC